jgi:ribosomal protein S18 acetylase RimI-like enzyme
MVVREARAEDVEAVVPLIYSSGPDTFDFVFSYETRLDAKAFLTAAYVTGNTEFGYRNHWVLEEGGHVVAIAAGHTGITARGFLWPTIGLAFRSNGLWKGARLLRRGLQAEGIIVPPKGSETFYIGQVGVEKDCQGRGLGRMLLDHVHEEGRKQGARFAVLDVSMENPRAQALYTRMGYEVTGERISSLRNRAGYVPSHRRMELSLEG